MNFKKTKLNGLYIINLEPFQDKRGIFQRVFCMDEFQKINHKKQIVQINHSITKNKGVVRGLHFQYTPKTEIKIIFCLNGSVFDVAVDVRKDSPTFLNWHGEILSSKNKKGIYIPEGFAHGFQTLKKNSQLLYLHTEFYNPEYQGGIKYNDPRISINWPLKVKMVSRRDNQFNYLNDEFKGISK